MLCTRYTTRVTINIKHVVHAHFVSKKKNIFGAVSGRYPVEGFLLLFFFSSFLLCFFSSFPLFLFSSFPLFLSVFLFFSFFSFFPFFFLPSFLAFFLSSFFFLLSSFFFLLSSFFFLLSSFFFLLSFFFFFSFFFLLFSFPPPSASACPSLPLSSKKCQERFGPAPGPGLGGLPPWWPPALVAPALAAPALAFFQVLAACRSSVPKR